MAESIDIVRQKLEQYSAKVGDEIDLHAFVEFAAETSDGEFSDRDFSTSVIRKTVEELHHKGEIQYIGKGKYRINDLQSDVATIQTSDTSQNNSPDRDGNRSTSDDSEESKDSLEDSAEDTLISNLMDDLYF